MLSAPPTITNLLEGKWRASSIKSSGRLTGLNVPTHTMGPVVRCASGARFRIAVRHDDGLATKVGLQQFLLPQVLNQDSVRRAKRHAEQQFVSARQPRNVATLKLAVTGAGIDKSLAMSARIPGRGRGAKSSHAVIDNVWIDPAQAGDDIGDQGMDEAQALDTPPPGRRHIDGSARHRNRQHRLTIVGGQNRNTKAIRVQYLRQDGLLHLAPPANSMLGRCSEDRIQTHGDEADMRARNGLRATRVVLAQIARRRRRAPGGQ